MLGEDTGTIMLFVAGSSTARIAFSIMNPLLRKSLSWVGARHAVPVLRSGDMGSKPSLGQETGENSQQLEAWRSETSLGPTGRLRTRETGEN